MSLAARLRHPLLRNLLQTQRLDVPWPVVVRNTFAVVTPLALGAATGHLDAGLGVSTGALNTMLADQPGPYGLRLRRMLFTALAAGIAAFAGSVLGQWPGALVIAAALWGFGAALLVAIGPDASRAGLVSMILLVVLGAEPHPITHAWQAAALIFGGGALQTLLAIAAWPLQRWRPERLALADALRAIATLARRDVAHRDMVALPPSLNDLEALLYGSGRTRGRALEAFQVLVHIVERIRLELLALADFQSQSASPATRAALQGIRQAAAAVLDSLARSLEEAAPADAGAALADYAAATGRLERDAQFVQERIVQIAVARAQALGGQLRAAARNTDTAGSRGEATAQRSDLRLPPLLRPANPLATLRANLRFSSVAFRHAVRCGACLALALVLSHLLPLSRGYWMPMTVAIVLKPDFGATWRFGLLRVAGTLCGLVLTTALLHFGFADFWSALALFAILCLGYRAFATVHYGIAVACITGLVVILLSFYGVPPEASMPARAIDTMAGSALALAAYLAWPTWERGRESEMLARMLDAYGGYLAAVLGGDARARHDARVAARAARSNALGSLERLRQEPRGKPHLQRAETLVSDANRFMRASMALEAARADAGGQPLPRHASTVFAEGCKAALDEAAQALRQERTANDTFHLRDLQRALAESLRENSAAIAAPLSVALLDASDRIVDAIDSLLHVLHSRA